MGSGSADEQRPLVSYPAVSMVSIYPAGRHGRSAWDARAVARGASTPHPANLCLLLQRHQNALVIRQRCAGLAPCSADWINKFTRDPWRASSPLCAGLGFRYTQGASIRFLQIHTHVNVAQEKLRRPGLNDILYLIFKFAVSSGNLLLR